MLRGRRFRSWGILAAGLILGLTIGGAVAVGVLLGQRQPSLAGMPSLAELKLKASASHGGENFAIATGYVDEDVEGLYTLDFVTGDLQCFVINPANGAPAGIFKTNVTSVLGVERGKKLSYLLVTGHINVAGGYGGGRPAASMCYVVDANSGAAAAYTFPWNKAWRTSGSPQAFDMKLVYAWKARNLTGQ